MAATETFMELVYSTQNSDFDPEKRYRNPAHFDRPEAGVTHAVVIGDWPKVVDAYEAQGVEVSVLKPLISQPVDSDIADTFASLEQDNTTLRAERDGIQRLIEAAEGLTELEHPDAGELPIRLFDALNGIRLQIETLVGERDSEVEKSRLLQKQVDDLLAQAAQARLNTDETKEAKDIAELKAKLDVAGVTYRANASKESLEKAVADLQQA
jgi:hypothetical protein